MSIICILKANMLVLINYCSNIAVCDMLFLERIWIFLDQYCVYMAKVHHGFALEKYGYYYIYLSA